MDALALLTADHNRVRGLFKFQRAQESDESVDESLEEHHQVKVLLSEASQLTPEDDAWLAKLTVIIEDVEHHAQEEEAEMFPQVRSRSSAEDREELGVTLDERKGELGAPVLADTIDLTVESLRELATKQAIPGRSTMDHDELAATVSPS
jgi:hypothetical protein